MRFEGSGSFYFVHFVSQLKLPCKCHTGLSIGNMRKAAKNGLLCAAIYASFEIGTLISGLEFHDNARFAAYAANSFLLLLAIAASILPYVPKSSAIDELKEGLKAAGVYSVAVSLFFALYFSTIAPDYMEVKKEMFRDKIEYVAERLEDIRGELPEDKQSITKEDYIEEKIEEGAFWFTPSKVIPITLFGLMILGFVYTFAMTALKRKVLYRSQKS